MKSTLFAALAAALITCAHAQATPIGTRVTACAAATPNNALCFTWTQEAKSMEGAALSGITFRVEQKFGSGTYGTVATGLANNQYYAQNLAVGTYTFRVFANCSAASCVESTASNEASKGASAIPVQPVAPIAIIAATIRADGPPVYRVISTVTPRAGEVVFVAPASMAPYFAAR